MKEVILKMLKEVAPGYLSGEDIAGRLEASRTTVWKNIKGLQKAGYDIEGSPRLGYRLLSAPDLLYPAEICEGLKTEIIAPGSSFVYHYIQLGSTNNRLKELAEEGAPEGTVVLAEEQTAGRGRLGRSWASPRSKGIWLSILLRPDKPLQEISVFTLLTAVAVARGINKKCPGIDVGIKWPNDILINNRKVCGILTELKAEADRLHYLITGIGLNYSAAGGDFPPELEGIATSVHQENSGQTPARKVMVGEILRQMDNIYGEYLNLGTKGILQQWRNLSITLGKRITIRSLQEFFSGVALDIDHDGALIVAGQDGELKRFVTGEIIAI